MMKIKKNGSVSMHYLAALSTLGIVLTAAPFAHATVNANFGDKGTWGGVIIENSGGGKVVSSETGCIAFNEDSGKCTQKAKINCDGSDNAVCEVAFPAGSKVTLTATPAMGYASCVAWGEGYYATKFSAIMMSDEYDFPVSFFEKSNVTVTVSIQQEGEKGGKVTSSPAGIKCDSTSENSTCDHDFPICSTIKLTATPQSGGYFMGWTDEDNYFCNSQTSTCSFMLTPDLVNAEGKVNVKLGFNSAKKLSDESHITIPVEGDDGQTTTINVKRLKKKWFK